MISAVSLAVNVLMLVALLSMLQATSPCPASPPFALTLGMAIDANVLINERVREEVRNGVTRERRSRPATNTPGRPFWIPTSPR